MWKWIALFAFSAALAFVALTNLAAAAPNAQAKLLATAAEPGAALAANQQRPRYITHSASSSGEKCGVWRCTWPVSGGGCLVWEKTLCKVKTINPFE